jgi:UDP-N-acetylmuramoylalanine--D-glutamate ligase
MAIGLFGRKFRQDIKNKKVLIFGLGVLGRGLKDALYLDRAGARVRVTDAKTSAELAASVKILKKHKRIKLILGRHRAADIVWSDIIVRNAGVRADSPWLRLAKKLKKKIVMDESLFAQYFSGKIIGITGTKGKSTVTGLIYQILKAENRNTFLGGNVRGLATLPLLDKVNDESRIILELSSWQLQGFVSIKKSPNFSVFTNIYPDHLNYYNSMADYTADKKNIYRWQKASDYLFVNDYQKESKKFASEAKGKVIVFKSATAKKFSSQLIGRHNLSNIAAAVAVARQLKVSFPIIKKAVATYSGEAYRVQIIGREKKKKLTFINDSAATTTAALLAGLEATQTIKHSSGGVILIIGGSDKNNNWDEIANPLKKYCNGVIILAGTAQEKILATIKKKKINLPIKIAKSMKEAVELAYLLARQGDIILLSPGCASFGMFKNEFDRGDKFNLAVKKYVK